MAIADPNAITNTDPNSLNASTQPAVKPTPAPGIGTNPPGAAVAASSLPIAGAPSSPAVPQAPSVSAQPIAPTTPAPVPLGAQAGQGLPIAGAPMPAPAQTSDPMAFVPPTGPITTPSSATNGGAVPGSAPLTPTVSTTPGTNPTPSPVNSTTPADPLAWNNPANQNSAAPRFAYGAAVPSRPASVPGDAGYSCQGRRERAPAGGIDNRAQALWAMEESGQITPQQNQDAQRADFSPNKAGAASAFSLARQALPLRGRWAKRIS